MRLLVRKFFFFSQIACNRALQPKLRIANSHSKFKPWCVRKSIWTCFLSKLYFRFGGTRRKPRRRREALLNVIKENVYNSKVCIVRLKKEQETWRSRWRAIRSRNFRVTSWCLVNKHSSLESPISADRTRAMIAMIVIENLRCRNSIEELTMVRFENFFSTSSQATSSPATYSNMANSTKSA